MAKRVFFSFHYENVKDFRVNVVRNHDMTKADAVDAGYYDASIWEEAKKKGALALKRLIHDGLENTSVTVVLIGSDTYNRRWVRYEIVRSIYRGNKVLGIHINHIPDKLGQTKLWGGNPFDYLAFEYSKNGTRLDILEYQNGQWQRYFDHEGWVLDTPNPSANGRVPKLSVLYPIYCWKQNDGYKNFGSWIK